MVGKHDELLKRLLVTFRAEADEHLKAMSSGLLALEKTPVGEQRAETVETIFREAHSLKGAARAVNLTHIESICQSLESVFAALKGGRLDVSPPLLDLLQQTIDALAGFLSSDAGASGGAHPPVAALIRRLDDALSGTLPESGAPAATTAPAELASSTIAHRPPVAPGLAPETVRVSTAKLDSVMRQVEELLAPRLAASQRASELREVVISLATWKKQRARMRPTLRLIERYVEGGRNNAATRGLQELPKLLEYLDAEQLHMKTIDDRLAKLKRAA